jgi:hypothetical protein
MALPRVTFTFDGAATDQSRGIRHLPLGAFAELRNTRQVKRGSLRKRRAFHRQAVTLTNLSTESVTNGTSFDGLGYASGALYRDNQHNFWALSSDRTTAYYRGNQVRVHPRLRAAGHSDNKSHKAISIIAGTDVWLFSLGDDGINFSRDQQYRRLTYSVFDAATGVRKVGPVGMVTGAPYLNYCVVYDGSASVWVFTVAQGRYVISHQINTASPTAPAATGTIYYDGGVDAVMNCVDATLIGGSIYLAFTSYNPAAGKGLTTRHSKLNAAGGNESTGVTSVALYVPANQALTCQVNNGPSFLEAQPGTNGYYAFWTVGSADAKAALKLCKFNLTTLAVVSLDTVGAEFNAALLGTAHAGLVSGFYDPADGHALLFAHIFRQSDSTHSARLVRYDHNPGGVTASTTVMGFGSTLASKPFKDTATGHWYILTQYDDTENKSLQRAWHVRLVDRAGPITKNIVTQVGWGRGAAAFHMWQSDLTGFTTSFVTQSAPFCPAVPLLSGKFYAGIELADTVWKTAPQVLILDTAAAYSPPAKLAGNLLVYPGGIPQVVGPADSARDLAVLMGPSVAPTAGVGAGTNLAACLVTYSYRYRTSDGRITRSPLYPQPASLVWKDGGGSTLSLQPLWHIGRDGNGAEVEVWATIPGGTALFLQFVLPNVADASVLTLSIDPTMWTALGEPQPVGLVATPPPPCRVVATFKDRLFLTGTDADGDLWYSQPLEEGTGVELNSEGLRQVIRGGAINAAAAIDWNTFALFHRDAVTCLQGRGPDGNGGAYETVDLHTAHGVEKTSTTGHVVVPTSRGIFYQSAEDTRIQLLGPGLQVVEASQGIETVVTAATIPAPILTAGLEVVNDGGTWLQFADGSTCVLDHRNPSQAAPLGELGAWHTWTSAALAAADAYSVGLVDAGGTPVWLSFAGHIRRPKTGADANPWQDDGGAVSDVLVKWKTGKVAPAQMHVEVLVSDVQLLGTHVGVSSCRLQVINDADVAENHDVTTSSPLNLSARPGNCLRTQEVEVSFEELSSSTEGPVVDGFCVEFRPQGQKRLATGRVF